MSELRTGFLNPPPAARLRCYWWWLNGNTNAATITHDLEEMKAKGFGGALLVDANGSNQGGNANVPAGPTFVSPAWVALYLHALREADRLGLEMTLNITSGWNLGGPASNYSVSINGTPTVTIQSATITVAVNNATRLYGAANPNFTGTLTGVLPADAANVSGVYSTSAGLTSAVGTYGITATSLTGRAAGNYKLGTLTHGTLTVTQAATTTSLVSSASSIAAGNNLTLTATIAPSTSGTPTGSVVFSTGSTTIGTVTLSGGVAVLQTSALTFGSDPVIATYQGSTNLTGSASSAVTVPITLPVVTGTASASTITIQSGSSGTVNLNFTAEGSYTGTAAYSCAFLATDMSRSFSPSSATFTSTTSTATSTLTISTSAITAASLTRPTRPAASDSSSRLLAAGIGLPALLLGLFGLRNRKRLHKWHLHCLTLLLLIAGLAGLSGCGASAGSTKTPAGTYNIEVEIPAEQSRPYPSPSSSNNFIAPHKKHEPPSKAAHVLIAVILVGRCESKFAKAFALSELHILRKE